jgi:hypothetical protein
MHPMPNAPWTSTVALAAFVLGLSSGAVAQQSGTKGDGDDPAGPGRGQCQAAAAILKQGRSHPRHDWAIGYIQFCAEEGPAFYVDQWHAAGADTSDLQNLVFDSARMRDGRIFETAKAIAQDRSRPDVVRVAAMVLLSKYVEPGNPLVIESLHPPDSVRRIPLFAGGAIEKPWALQGSIPLPAGFESTVLTLLRDLAADRTSEPRDVWYAAAVIARRVESDINAHSTP